MNFNNQMLQLKQILDTRVPAWLKEFKITVLPPKASAFIKLLDALVQAMGSIEYVIGLQLPNRDLEPFNLLLKKLGLCLPVYMDRLYWPRYYKRDALVCCGYCDDDIAAYNPMTLSEARRHLIHDHKNEPFKVGMLRLARLGEDPVDGRCNTCDLPLLAEAREKERKSGVQCVGCGGKWCFECMDDRIWIGPMKCRRALKEREAKPSPWLT